MRGNAAGAVEDLTTAVRAGRDDAGVHMQIVQALLQLKRYRDAEAECDLAMAHSDDVWMHRMRGFARLAGARFDRAEEDYSSVLEAEPEDAESLCQRGMARFGRGDIPGALADYDRALSLAPDNRSCRGSRVIACGWLGDLETAARECEALQAADGDDVETLGAWGVLELTRGAHDAAIARFAAAAQQDKAWGAFHGLARLAAGELEEARRAYEEAIAAGAPGDAAFAINELDRCMETAGRLVAPEARAAAVAIRTRLVEAVDAVDSAGPSASVNGATA